MHVFFPYTINGIRQALIISISIYLIHKLSFENYNFKKLFLISFLSIFIHASGIFLLVFLLIRRIKITPFFLSIYLIIGLILIRYFSEII